MKPVFVDYYELMELSPRANSATIERVFRHFAKRLHPDVSETGDVQKFSLLVEAYETLRDPELRVAYDLAYEQEQQQLNQIVEDTNCIDDDSAQRHKILALMYAKRRRDMKEPGIGGTTLESLSGCTEQVLNFHLWYFRQKGWIEREENGMLAITALGVDRIEASVEAKARTIDPRLTFENSRVEQHV